MGSGISLATDVSVVVREGAVLRGRIVSGGEPVSGAWLQAREPGGNRARWLASTTADKDGIFELRPLPPEEPFNLTINSNQHKPLSIENVTVASAATPAALHHHHHHRHSHDGCGHECGQHLQQATNTTA